MCTCSIIATWRQASRPLQRIWQPKSPVRKNTSQREEGQNSNSYQADVIFFSKAILRYMKTCKEYNRPKTRGLALGRRRHSDHSDALCGQLLVRFGQILVRFIDIN